MKELSPLNTFPLLYLGDECCLSIPFRDVMHPYFLAFRYTASQTLDKCPVLIEEHCEHDKTSGGVKIN